MDWNFKLSSGYLTQFDQESVPDLSPIDASISFGNSQTKPDFSFDLKLGNLGNSSGLTTTEQVLIPSKWKETAQTKPEGSRSSGSSSKRTRGNGIGNQMPFCLVDGCDSDFSNCREYHRRHKVCDIHSKTPVVTINGHKQRFCQQCSRFHPLEEFDEGKRSCRKRLDGHNRRRRKPQPDHLARSSNLFTGTKLLQFSGSSHVFPTTSVISPGQSWGNGYISPGQFTSPEKTGIMFPISSSNSSDSSSYNKAARKQQFLPFEQAENSRGQSRTTSLCERMTSCIHDSDCALSLLSSSSSRQIHSPDISLGHIQANSVSHLVHHQQQQQQPPLSLVETGFYGSGLFENVSAGSDGSAISGTEAVRPPQAFPFHWE